MSKTKFLRDTAEFWPNHANVHELAMQENFDLSLNEIVAMANPQHPKPNDDEYLNDVRNWLLVRLRRGRRRYDPHSRTMTLIRAKLAVLAMVRRSRTEKAEKLSSPIVSSAMSTMIYETKGIAE